MKLYKLLFLFISLSVFSQNSKNELKFDKKFYEGTDKWVVFPKSTSLDTYPFGIIYIDQMAGFTFEYIGNLKVENDNLINLDTSKVRTNSMKQRLQSNTRDLHILNKDQIKELNLEPTSTWLEAYKINEDKPSYKIDIASFYNGVGGSKIALQILNQVYKTVKKDKKMLFELSYSYNALKNYEKAKEILLEAIKIYPDNELFYKELSYAYMNMKDLKMTENTYQDYIKSTTQRRYQNEMAYNLAYSFFILKDKIKFNQWAKIVRDKSEPNSVLFKNIEAMTKELE